MGTMIDQDAPEVSPEEAAKVAESMRAHEALYRHLFPQFMRAAHSQIAELFNLIGWHRECGAACVPGTQHVEYMEATISDEGDEAPAAVFSSFLWENFGVAYQGHEPTERRASIGPYSIGSAVYSDGEVIALGERQRDGERPANTRGYLVRFKCADPLDEYRAVAYGAAEGTPPEPPSTGLDC